MKLMAQSSKFDANNQMNYTIGTANTTSERLLPQFVEDQSVNCLGEEELEGSNLHSSPVSLARSTYFCKIIEKIL